MDTEKIVIYVGRSSMLRQYRTTGDCRISDGDGWWFGTEKVERVNFAFSETSTNPDAIKKVIGEIGLEFVKNLAATEGFRVKQLLIVSAWQINIVLEEGQDIESLDRMVITAIEATLHKTARIEPETRMVGAVIL